ncbi:DEAD-box ATP-dependent RNA helicase 13 isoform X2 [Nymphaea colorata]|uniref:DEAD-box ATP-dependent RNA helicase 13 isoform X2 n=1 Tax=Nymphaea colorata TaxID=210225 RepID=UPI00129D54FE|nr:DEAD-box ATP-dependent RNA helicase 13 isoform X2 [Nymphaea colorata]
MAKKEKTLKTHAPKNLVPGPVTMKKKKKKTTEKRNKVSNPNAEIGPDALDSTRWSSSFLVDESLSLLLGSSEGGFLSLEELDESDFVSCSGLDLQKLPSSASRSKDTEADDRNPSGDVKKKEKKKKKNKDKTLKKQATVDADTDKDVSCLTSIQEPKMPDGGKEQDHAIVSHSKKRKSTEEHLFANENSRKKKKKKKKEVKKTSQVDDAELTEAHPDLETTGQRVSCLMEEVDEAEFFAWKGLRLHPLLMKSIYELRFKEPTPIQKACIPMAAHKGKDIIGAAETGSGKTLAFGLPILQRLLEEQEKASALNNEIVVDSLRALIVTPTRELAMQVTDHLKAAAKYTKIQVVSIVGGVSSQKQERLLKRRPQIIVGTPGRLWELMSGGDIHLVELESLSFFVLDEADRMIENGHFQELQSIIDMLPKVSGRSLDNGAEIAEGSHACETISRIQRKKRQTFVLSATVALSENFRRKLKRGSLSSKSDTLNSMETLVERTGMRADAAIVDLTNASIMAHKLEESVIECKEEDKDSYLYYILSIHGHGRTIVFCTSCAALRRVASILRILELPVWTLHSRMQQRARLKAIDHFRSSEHGILVATDVAARGLDVPGVRTVIHYQLPHSAEIYIHRSGRTARASSDGCSIALISPTDRSKFSSLCKSFSKESLNAFPLDSSYMPAVVKRLSLAYRIDKVLHMNAQENSKKSWFERNAESLELNVEDDSSEGERESNHRQKRNMNLHLNHLKKELNKLLSRPLQPTTFSHRFVAGAGMSPLLQQQLREFSHKKQIDHKNVKGQRRSKIVVIGRDLVEPLQELRKTTSL